MFATLIGILKNLCCTVLLSALSLLLWQMYNWTTRDLQCAAPLPPGHYGLPFIGESLMLLTQGTRFLNQKQKQLGNIYKTHLFGKPTVRIIGADNVREILQGENTLVSSDWPRSAHALLEGGMALQASGLTHGIRKKAVLKAFSHESLCRYIPTMSNIADMYINKWCDLRSVDLYSELRTLSFEIACTCLLGFNLRSEQLSSNMQDFELFMKGMFSIPIDMPGFSFHKAVAARSRLLRQIEGCIQDRKRNDQGEKARDVLTFLHQLDGDDQMEPYEIKCICLELLFAGHETSTSAATSLILNLCNHPDINKKLTDELREYGADNKDDINIDIINRLGYLRNVVTETLRLTPPIGAGYRKAIKTFVIEGYQIPKGWTVAYSIRETHETSDYFTNPTVFNPERWNSKSADDKMHFLTFGGGKRRCVGKDFAQLLLKVLFVKILRSCTIRLKNKNVRINNFPSPRPVESTIPVFISRI